jgi:hypothetical protein
VTTSGTSGFNLDLNDIIEEAFERCGVEVRTGYEHRTARRSLNLLTIEWANRGINLWTIEQGSLPLVQGQIVYTLPEGTIDLLIRLFAPKAASIRLTLTSAVLVFLPTQQSPTRIPKADPFKSG